MKKLFGAFIALFLVVGMVSPASAGGKNSNSDLFWIPPDNETPPELVGGGSKTILRRGTETLTVRVRDHDVEPGHAFTVWAVIFDNPGACMDGCNGPDLGNPAVNGSVIWSGAGGVSNPGGKLNITGMFGGDLDRDQIAGMGDGTVDPENAEIHFVVRDHGVSTGDPAQTTEFEPGCDVCADIHFSIHLP